jgi:hypothetical protein
MIEKTAGFLIIPDSASKLLISLVDNPGWTNTMVLSFNGPGVYK